MTCLTSNICLGGLLITNIIIVIIIIICRTWATVVVFSVGVDLGFGLVYGAEDGTQDLTHARQRLCYYLQIQSHAITRKFQSDRQSDQNSRC